MPRFFVPSDQIDIEANSISIKGDDAHHISRSLRMAAGEHITVCDMCGTEYDCILESFLPDVVEAKILSSSKADTEPPFEFHLYQALPKGDKLDAIIQKSVECGASSITTFESERCIAHERDGKTERKLERRKKIALEAAKQCGRGIIPDVCSGVDFKEAIERAKISDIPIFCYEGDGTESLKQLIKKRIAEISKGPHKKVSISAVIGSEGGFSKAEADYARENGMLMAGLGKRILRTETVSSFVLGCIVYELEL